MTKNDLYWYEYLPETKAVYFKLSTYGEMEVLNKRNYNKESNISSGERTRDFGDFASFLEDMIAFMKDNKPEKLVIDLRGNNGGIPSILKDLREYIEWDSDFPERGSVFLLVDKGSFSAPILECTFYKDNLKAIVVGEPTGERPFVFGCGGADSLMLPKSRVSILYSAGEFTPIDKNIDSVVPDLVVNVSFEEYRNGIDPVLKAALDYPIK
jgi:C-terminal processing protease CtpA/Prc